MRLEELLTPLKTLFGDDSDRHTGGRDDLEAVLDAGSKARDAAQALGKPLNRFIASGNCNLLPGCAVRSPIGAVAG